MKTHGNLSALSIFFVPAAAAAVPPMNPSYKTKYASIAMQKVMSTEKTHLKTKNLLKITG